MWRLVHRVGVVMLMDHLQVLRIIPTVDHRAHTISRWLYPWMERPDDNRPETPWISTNQLISPPFTACSKTLPMVKAQKADAQNGMPLHVF